MVISEVNAWYPDNLNRKEHQENTFNPFLLARPKKLPNYSNDIILIKNILGENDLRIQNLTDTPPSNVLQIKQNLQVIPTSIKDPDDIFQGLQAQMGYGEVK